MKKMQCETCGSTDIKKINDDVFECQSCGVQYSGEEAKSLLVEITGTVKIDHSDEVDNALKRAEQFVNDGDTTKAEEYYNKALDLDAENKKANEEIKKIKKEKSLPQNIFLLEKDIDSTKSITRFLKNLKEQNNIAPDIYKEIEIISTTEQYFPFLIINGTYSGSYYGTACYRKEVKYTEWVDYTGYVYRNPTPNAHPVTKTKTDYDKEHSSGTYNIEHTGVYSVSTELKDLGLITHLEFHLNTSYDKLCKNIIPMKPDNIPNDIPVNIIQKDNESLKRIKSRHTSSVEEKCDVCAVNCVGGDEAENVSFDYKIDREDISNLYLPIQIIKYVYKGDIYCAINILSTKFKYSDLRYPYLKQLDNLVDEHKKLIDKHKQENIDREQSTRDIQPKGGYGAWAWTIAIFALLVGWIFGKNTYLFRDILYAFAYVNLGLGAFLTILGLFYRSKLTKIKKENLKIQKENLKTQEENVNEVNSLRFKYENELEKEYKIFFDNYTGIDSISKCNDIIEKNCDFSCPVSDIVGAEEDDYDSEDFEEAQDEDEYDEED